MAHDQQGRLLKALIDIGQELASTIDLDDLLNRILRASKEIFRFQNAIIRLLDEDGVRLNTVASFGYAAEAIRQEIRIGQGIMGKVAARGKPILVSDVDQVPDYIPGIYGARSELAVPLLVQDKVIGVFSVESHRPNAFSEDDISPLLTLAGQAAIAIENARLYQNLREISEQYRHLHQFNRRILQSANLGIYTIDAQGIITSWNRKMEELSGVEASVALGKNLFELFPSLEEEGFAARMRRVLSRGAPEKLRLAHRDKRGQIRIQKRRLAPLKEGDQTVGVVVMVEDITEFKRLLDQTIQSEKMVEIGRLSAGIAHEINNPLAVISYAAQLLLREEDMPAFQREMVERVESEVDRLKTLTGGLLSFSRAKETRKRPVDLNEVLREVLRLVKYELNRQLIRLEEDYGDLPMVQADPNKLKQVFINLIMNSIQAMEGVGTLTVRTRSNGGNEVEVAISDTGPGIPEEIRNQIFDPFFTTKKEGEGTGLGLYICRTIIGEHEGRLSLDTPQEKGTIFRIALPVE